MHHPEAIFGQEVEATVFDPTNPYVLSPQLRAAAQEAPIRAEELSLFDRIPPRYWIDWCS